MEDILDVLEAIRIDPSSETLSILICTNIEMGDLTTVDTLWQLCDQYRVVFKRKYYFDIIYTYVMCGFDDEIDKVPDKPIWPANYIEVFVVFQSINYIIIRRYWIG